MRHAPHAAALFFTFAALAPTGEALAQERELVVQAPAIPDLPILDGAKARRVARLERVARRSLRCVEYEGDRGGEEYSDERCWEWFERLSNTRSSGVHAAGRALLASLERDDEVTGSHHRLITILGYSERRVAAVYLLHLLAHALEEGPDAPALAASVIQSLVGLSRIDAAPVAPWVNRFDALRPPEAREAALSGWVRWYDAAQHEPYRSWRRAGLAHAEAHLMDDDPAVRFAAIDRLRSARRLHHALVRSIRDLLVRDDLTPSARRYVSRYAGRHALMTRAEIRELLETV